METKMLQSEIDAKLRQRMLDAYDIPSRNFNHKVKRGLRNSDGTGVLAGVTKVGRVTGYHMESGEIIPIPGQLHYRGIDVCDIVESHTKNGTFGYEEVAYLLLMGNLPTKSEFASFDDILSKARPIPANFMEDMILKAPSRDIMNKLSRSVLALYSFDPNPDDISLENVLRQSIQLIARFPTIVTNAYAVKRHHFDGKSLYIHMPKEELSVAENFLRMLRNDKHYTQEEAHLLDLMMILHAEHGGGNNSAFVCRALSSTETDTYSAIAGAVSSLKGPLHGGANAKIKNMFATVKENVSDPTNDAQMRDCISDMVDKKIGDGSGKVFGLGHAVYTVSDPRTEIIKRYAEKLVKEKGLEEDFEYLKSIERVGVEVIMEKKNMDKQICANVDLYSGLVIRSLGIPDELFTPLFAISRISGWCAHRMEEIATGKRIMRPAYRAAVEKLPYVDIDAR